MTATFQENIRKEKATSNNWASTFGRSSRRSSRNGRSSQSGNLLTTTMFATRVPLTSSQVYGRAIITDTALRITNPKKWNASKVGCSVTTLDFNGGFTKELAKKSSRPLASEHPTQSPTTKLPRYLKAAPSGNEYVDSYPRNTRNAAFHEAFPREYKEGPPDPQKYLKDVFYADDGGKNNCSNDVVKEKAKLKAERHEILTNEKLFETLPRNAPKLRFISSLYAEENGGLVAPAPDAVKNRKTISHDTISRDYVGKTWDFKPVVYERSETLRLQGVSPHRRKRGISSTIEW